MIGDVTCGLVTSHGLRNKVLAPIVSVWQMRLHLDKILSLHHQQKH